MTEVRLAELGVKWGMTLIFVNPHQYVMHMDQDQSYAYNDVSDLSAQKSYKSC